jgi:L-threonylcarbamoyladenylate synthase
MLLKYSKKNEKTIIKTAVSILRKGGLIIYPTETLYGIGCDATNKRAVAKVYKIKKRKRNLPVSILVSSKTMAKKYVSLSQKAIGKLPGRYTFILPVKRKLPVSKDMTGIRLPKHWCTKLTRALDKPIVSTSVNISKRKPLTDIKKIQKIFGSKIALYIDQGKLTGPATKVYLGKKRLR